MEMSSFNQEMGIGMRMGMAIKTPIGVWEAYKKGKAKTP